MKDLAIELMMMFMALLGGCMFLVAFGILSIIKFVYGMVLGAIEFVQEIVKIE